MVTRLVGWAALTQSPCRELAGGDASEIKPNIVFNDSQLTIIRPRNYTRSPLVLADVVAGQQEECSFGLDLGWERPDQKAVLEEVMGRKGPAQGYSFAGQGRLTEFDGNDRCLLDAGPCDQPA
ncbi:hypothetical protein EN751_34890 [Mesorhizobium sp. M4A.F.Ca.ET.029.04.2.1]|nr:hypothetical protein EN751_34890 [Mesorhizobium sp. M4A.F.Ca.ET.029.04.2.1]